MYCIFLKFRGGIQRFLIPPPLYTQKIVLGGIKNDVTEMIHLLAFQSITNVLYFFKFWEEGGREIFFIPPPPYTKK